MKNANKNNKFVKNKNGETMHRIKVPNQFIRTDLIIEQKKTYKKQHTRVEKGLKIEEVNIENHHYTTIFFEDITNQEDFEVVEQVFTKELGKYLKTTKEDKYLVIGLGNQKSTPDSLGPSVVDQILVTRYLFLLGAVEDGYSNVASFAPNVMGNTGIETMDIIKSLLEKTDINKVIVVDSLKTNHLTRLGKTIQITNHGISPGSGIGNMRKELSNKTLNKEVIAIGIPTVVDLHCLTDKDKLLSDNFMVTPTNIDFMIEKLSLLISRGINSSLHKNFIRQNDSY